MITPKRPTSGQWIRRGDRDLWGIHFEVYDSIDGMRVLSSVQAVDATGRREYHVAVSSFGVRPSRERLRAALAAFGMREATEDNSEDVLEPGCSRHFWLPVSKEGDHAPMRS